MNERRNSGGMHEARPHTSNSNRKEVQRPSTSHDRRPDMGRPPPPPQSYQMPPARASPAMEQQPPTLPPQNYAMPPTRESPEMSYQQPPIPKLQNGLNSPRIRPSGPPGPGPQRGPPPQGPASPPMNLERPRPAPIPSAAAVPHGGMAEYDSRGPHKFREHQPPPDRRPNNYMFDEGYASDNIPPSRAYGSPVDPVPSNNQPRSAPQPDYRANSYRGIPPSSSGKFTQNASNEIPNFDAIPTRPHERVEDQMIANQQPTFNQQIYRRPTYQASDSSPGPIDTTQSRPSPPNQTTSPLADFSFDLPSNNPSMTATRSENSAQSAPHRGGYEDRGPNAPGPSAGGYGDSNPRQMPASQFPPRAASRNGMKPPMANDASRPPLPQGGQPPYRSFSQDQYPARPHTSNAQMPLQSSSAMMNPYDQAAEPRAPSAPVPGPQNQSNGYRGQKLGFQQPYGQGPPMRKVSRDNYNAGAPGPYGQAPPMRQASHENYNPAARMNGVSSGIVPIRNYGAPAPPTNPDTLPAHPTPARGGQNGSNGYAANQPQTAPSVQKRDVSGPVPALSKQELDNLRQMYSSKPGDQALGLKLAKKMVEAAKILADENGTADAKTTQKNREKYIFDAHKLIKKLVGANYPDAMFFLADCYGQGMLGLAVDPKEAFTLYQSAAKLNHPQSAYRVAVCCELGSEEGGGTRRDPLKSMQWYKRAATLGDTPAMYKMGMILLKGLLGQPKNPREAVSWLKRAAERADKDNPHGLHELGLLYESPTPPDNILHDERYAFQLFQQAAELGYKYSQFRLGSAYEYGLLGCPIDARQSIAWYTRAAAQSEHQSELALSGWYLTGSEPLLTQSDTEAFLWARKAASSGLAKAEYAMGYFNEVGIGTAVDVEEAKRWYYRAACEFSSFHPSSSNVERVVANSRNSAKFRQSPRTAGRAEEGWAEADQDAHVEIERHSSE